MCVIETKAFTFSQKIVKLFFFFLFCLFIFQVIGNEEVPEDEEIDELEEDDRDKFNDQLCSIGSLGRLVPDHTVPLLAK